MTAVYYSLACDPQGRQGRRERQWARSVESLRRYNAEIDVCLFLYGEASPAAHEAARSASVHVLPMGQYAAALGDIPAHWRNALATYPLLHKLISLRRLAAMGLDSLLYLDCDTYVMGDVAQLPLHYAACSWYAREEPNSSRSHHGYDASYVDEGALYAIAAAEGLVPVAPYNTGVFIVRGDLIGALADLVDDLVWYAWRLLLGACLWRPELVDDPRVVHDVREHTGGAERRLALPYPSSNGWILEEISTWLTLGRVPGLTHDVLQRADVTQNGEYAESSECIVAHYFTNHEQRFFARLGSVNAP